MIPLFMGASIKSPIVAPVVVALGQPVIDLGAGNGQLLFPVQVLGKWYYHWDRDGSWASDIADKTNHSVLDGIFNKDINGVVNTTVANFVGKYGTTDVYRYATINGVKLALPTKGAASIGYLTDNGVYTDLAAIWDAYNSGTSSPGIPPNWLSDNGTYYAADAPGDGHNRVDLQSGIVYRYAGDNPFYAALEVLSVPPPSVQVVPGQAVIDLGYYGGKLRWPVQVEGKWYYFWDKSGTGTADASDQVTHDLLDGIFNRDINGVVNTTVANGDGKYGTTDTYRYGTLNGVKLALPTHNGGVPTPSGLGNYQYGTAASGQGTSDNPTYSGMLAVWDAFNGTSTSFGNELNGHPPNWSQANSYWTSTPTATNHVAINMGVGYANGSGDTTTFYVALEVTAQ